MIRKIGLLSLLSCAYFVQAMDSSGHQAPAADQASATASSSDYIIRQTGFGQNMTEEKIYNPEMAAMMRAMDQAEAACYIREAAQRAERDRLAQEEAEKSFGSGFGKGFLNKNKNKNGKN